MINIRYTISRQQKLYYSSLPFTSNGDSSVDNSLFGEVSLSFSISGSSVSIRSF